MYEIVWSTFNDAYVIREMVPHSTLAAKFIGTLPECVAYLSNLK